jgi:Ca-activated chloride channel family protein
MLSAGCPPIMHASFRWLSVVTATVLLVSPAGAQRIKVTTQTVPLYVTVTDEQKRLVPDLTREDFEVYDNAKLQTVTNFDNEPTPITVVVMLDTSGSMTLALDLVKSGAEEFLMRMLPIDKGMVGAFNDKIEFHPASFTDNRDQLARALKDLDFGYPTRLYDAIDQSIDQLNGAEGRKTVLVFTDGDDNSSRKSSGAVLERARAEEVMIYSIGLENEYFNGQQRVRSSPDRALRKLSDETGGGFFLLKKKDDLGPTFTRVAQELHSQYILGFSPEALDGKIHKLEVRLKRPGLIPRARKSYVATRVDLTQK